jgi:hypothetical protein
MPKLNSLCSKLLEDQVKENSELISKLKDQIHLLEIENINK